MNILNFMQRFLDEASCIACLEGAEGTIRYCL